MRRALIYLVVFAIAWGACSAFAEDVVTAFPLSIKEVIVETRSCSVPLPLEAALRAYS